jgi:hypothetical protein
MEQTMDQNDLLFNAFLELLPVHYGIVLDTGEDRLILLSHQVIEGEHTAVTAYIEKDTQHTHGTVLQWIPKEEDYSQLEENKAYESTEITPPAMPENTEDSTNIDKAVQDMRKQLDEIFSKRKKQEDDIRAQDKARTNRILQFIRGE